MELIIQGKETAVSNLDNANETTAKTQPVQLMDCGPASQMTKGFPFILVFEASPPPWDRALLF